MLRKQFGINIFTLSNAICMHLILYLLDVWILLPFEHLIMIIKLIHHLKYIKKSGYDTLKIRVILPLTRS